MWNPAFWWSVFDGGSIPIKQSSCQTCRGSVNVRYRKCSGGRYYFAPQHSHARPLPINANALTEGIPASIREDSQFEGETQGVHAASAINREERIALKQVLRFRLKEYPMPSEVVSPGSRMLRVLTPPKGQFQLPFNSHYPFPTVT